MFGSQFLELVRLLQLHVWNLTVCFDVCFLFYLKFYFGLNVNYYAQFLITFPCGSCDRVAKTIGLHMADLGFNFIMVCGKSHVACRHGHI